MGTSCPICLEYLGRYDAVATPCGHVFHTHCMLQWIDSNKACPECRKKILPKDLTKLFLFYAQHDSVSGPQTELDSKVAELHAKEVAICKVEKKTTDLLEHASRFEELYASTHRKYLAVQKELDPKKRDLSKLKTTVMNLIREKDFLQCQVKHFIAMQKILRGSPQEAEEVLNEQRPQLADEVGEEDANSMSREISLSRQGITNLNNEKELLLDKKRQLLRRLCYKDVELAELQKSESDLKQELVRVYDSAKPIDVGKDNVVQSETCMPVQIPVKCDCQRKVLGEVDGQCNVTPVAVDSSEKKKRVKPVLENTDRKESAALKRFLDPSLFSFRRKMFEENGGSTSSVGYSGFGRHDSLMMRIQMENPKPYKRNPNVKKRK